MATKNINESANEVINNVDELEQVLQQEVSTEPQPVEEQEVNQPTEELVMEVTRKRAKWTSREKWLIGRMEKLLGNSGITDAVLKEFTRMIENWKKNWVAREMQRLQAELNRLEDMKKSL